MVSYCVACGKSANQEGAKGLSFHRFPLFRPEVCQKWVDFLCRKDFRANQSSRLCSEHFTEDSYVFRPGAERRLLKEDAVPGRLSYFKETSLSLNHQRNISNAFLESSSLPIKQEPLNEDLAPHIENVGSTNKILVVPNRPGPAPKVGNYYRNGLNNKNMVIVSDPTIYQNVLNSDTNPNRRIIVSDGSNIKKESCNSLENAYCVGAASTDCITRDPKYRGLSSYKEDPLYFCDNEFHSEQIRELEEVLKALANERKNWFAKIRRREARFKNLRKEYFKYTRKERPLLRCNSQPVVHFLTLDV